MSEIAPSFSANPFSLGEASSCAPMRAVSKEVAVFVGSGGIMMMCLARYLEQHVNISVVDFATTPADGLGLVQRVRPAVVFVDLYAGVSASVHPLGVLPGVNFVARTRGVLGSSAKVIAYCDRKLDAIFPQLSKLRANGFFSSDDQPEEWVKGISNVLAGADYYSGGFWAAKARRKDDPVPRFLTDIQKQILPMMAAGLSSKEIARHVRRTEKAVRDHTAAIRRKLGLHERAEIATFCAQWGYAWDASSADAYTGIESESAS